MIHARILMKTVTVHDLRNRFASVAKWIERGEPVAITRHGAAFAVLSPAVERKPQCIDWAKRLAKRPGLGQPSTKGETNDIWKALRD